ncbi:MAG: AsmA family protein, partial [Sinobacteraceae bacterium]|nr:AsmA family protein [Nevskiaceae bacterium]
MRGAVVLKWIGIGIGAFLLLLILALALLDWNWFKHPIERIASADTGRTVRINGNLQGHLLTWKPSFTVNDLSVGNPPWETGPPMLQVQRLTVHLKLLPLLAGDVILPRVEVISPNVYLHQDKQGRANWTFENQKPT